MLKKIMSVALTAAQVGLFLTAVPAFSAGPTPEFTLMQGAIALQGQNLPAEKFQSSVAGLYKQYTATADPNGAEQRLSDALVQLKLYTPVQSDAMVSEFEAASQRLVAQQYTSEAAANNAMTLEVTSILGSSPSGAQFSACGVATVADLVLGIGGGLALIGAGVDYIQYLNEGSFSNGGLDTKSGNIELTIGGVAGIAACVGMISILTSMHAC